VVLPLAGPGILLGPPIKWEKEEDR